MGKETITRFTCDNCGKVELVEKQPVVCPPPLNPPWVVIGDYWTVNAYNTDNCGFRPIWCAECVEKAKP